MKLKDFRWAIALLDAEPHCVPITAFLQGGLSVTGTWSHLDEEEPSAIVMEDHNGVRHVVPIETITSLREVRPEVKVRIPLAVRSPATCGAPIRRSLLGKPIYDEVG